MPGAGRLAGECGGSRPARARSAGDKRDRRPDTPLAPADLQRAGRRLAVARAARRCAGPPRRRRCPRASGARRRGSASRLPGGAPRPRRLHGRLADGLGARRPLRRGRLRLWRGRCRRRHGGALRQVRQHLTVAERGRRGGSGRPLRGARSLAGRRRCVSDRAGRPSAGRRPHLASGRLASGRAWGGGRHPERAGHRARPLAAAALRDPRRPCAARPMSCRDLRLRRRRGGRGPGRAPRDAGRGRRRGGPDGAHR